MTLPIFEKVYKAQKKIHLKHRSNGRTKNDVVGRNSVKL